MKRIQAVNDIKKAELSLNKITKGRNAFYEEDLNLLDQQLIGRQKSIELERKSALIGVNEVERRIDINTQYDQSLELLKKQYYINVANREQQEGAYRIAQLQVEQARQLQALDAKTATDRAVRSTDPSNKLSTLSAGGGFFSGSAALEIEQAILFTENLDKLSLKLKQVQDQIAEGSSIGGNIGEDALNQLRKQEQAIKQSIGEFKKYQPAVDAAALAQARFNDAMAITVPVTDSFVNGLVSVVEGTKTAEQAFADFLRTIADMLLQTAKRMIAQYIAIGIAKAFAGMGGGFNSPAASPGGSAGVAGIGGGGLGDVFGNTSLFEYAEGGYVNKPTNALIGEGGEPEYVIPESKMRESMSRYSRGSRGNSVIPTSGGGAEDSGGGTAVAAPIDVRYTVERINSVDYVTADQFQSGMKQAASQGAKQGEQQTLKRLQMSGGTRKRLGM